MSLLSSPSPAHRAASRHEMMDVSRGFAVLGILWLNIFLFALPFEAVVIPGIWGEQNALNVAVWEFTTTAVAGVMRGMFSILFGASAMLLLSRAERAGDQVSAIDRYFRRLIWLIVFGAVHAYLLIWPHDILYAYGVLGMLIFPFRHVSSRRLLLVALVMLVGSSIFTGRNVEELGDARTAAERSLTDEQREELQEDEPLVDELDEFGALEPSVQSAALDAPPEGSEEDNDYERFIENIAAEMAVRQGSYWSVMKAMAPDSFQQQTTEMVGNHLLDIGGFMALGMVLFRSGFFFGRWPRSSYVRIAVGGLALGLAIGVLSRVEPEEGNLLFPVADFASEYGFDLRRLLLALANFAFIALLLQTDLLLRLRAALAACGRMALSLYLAQTVICNFVFLGYGLNQFGQLEHYQIAVVGFGLTLVQLASAPFVLRRFGQGPVERLMNIAIEWGRPQPAAPVAPAQNHSAPAA